MPEVVCVIGSLNEDTSLRVVALPAHGETTMTSAERRISPGGKGANQAAAAAALGAQVVMVGAVGDDEPGRRSLAALEQLAVTTSGVRRRSDSSTGVAVITVDSSGENTIVVDAGANSTLSAEEVASSVRESAAALVLAQLEVPLAAVEAGLRAAGEALVVLNPAPMPDDPEAVWRLLPLVDVLVPNRGELGQLAGRPTPRDADEIAACVRALDLPGSVVVTLGADGALLFAKGDTEPVVVRGDRVETIDASGAGDVFCGCLARELVAGTHLVDAVRRANTVAAASTTHHGARVPAGFGA